MRCGATSNAAAAAAELILDDPSATLDFAAVFSRLAPVEVDLGCGDGALLSAMAAQRPDCNFLGIERLLGRVRSACHKIASRSLRNARVLRTDLTHAAHCLLPPASVAACQLMFPDPWPKRRHQSRRIVTPEFLDAIHRALAPAGTLRVVTDDAAYFAHIERLVSSANRFVQVGIGEPTELRSTFEQRFEQAGIQIYRATLRKV